jgi:hypothetical protein
MLYLLLIFSSIFIPLQACESCYQIILSENVHLRKKLLKMNPEKFTHPDQIADFHHLDGRVRQNDWILGIMKNNHPEESCE